MKHLKQCLARGSQSVKDSCNYHTYFISSLPRRKEYFSPFIQGQSWTYISEHVSPTYITNIHWALVVCQVSMQMLRIRRWTRQKFYQPLCPPISSPSSSVLIMILSLYLFAHLKVTDDHLEGVFILPELPSSIWYYGLPTSSWHPYLLRYHTPSWFFPPSSPFPAPPDLTGPLNVGVPRALSRAIFFL